MTYMAEYNYLDYNYGYEYFKKHKETISDVVTKNITGGCSAFYKNGIIGRNLDWMYSKNCTCILKTKDTIGVAGALNDLTVDYVDTKTYNDLYKLLPFFTQDGVNKKGLSCSVLEMPFVTPKTIPVGELHNEVCSIMLTRYILDNFSTVREAQEYIREHVSVYFTASTIKMGCNMHWFLADRTGACGVLEPINNEIIFREQKQVTNFPVWKVKYNSDGTVYTPSTQADGRDAHSYNKIHQLGTGLERYNMIVKKIKDLKTILDYKNLLNDLSYSKTYDVNKTGRNSWFTEFVGGTDATGQKLKINSEWEKFLYPMHRAYKTYLLRSRDHLSTFFGTYNTNHSIIYDLNKKELHITTQERYEDWKRISMFEHNF